MNGETASETARTLVTGPPAHAAPLASSGRCLPPREPLQARPDQVLDVPVEHLAGVVPGKAGAVVLDVLLVEDVGADLRTPLDRLLFAAGLGLLFEALLLLPLEQSAAQNRHGFLAVLDLGLAVLAAHHDLLRRAALVDDAHGRVSRVDRLPTRTGGAEDIHADVARVDVHLDAVVDLGHDIHGGEARVAPALGVERAHPHEAVHAALDGQHAEGALAPHDDLRVVDGTWGRIVADQVDQLNLEAPALGKAPVHAQQHARPVGGLVATGARRDGHDGGALIVIPLEQGLAVQLIEAPFDLLPLILELLRLVLPRNLGKLREVRYVVLQLLEPLNDAPQAGVLLGDLARPVRVVPQVRVVQLRFELFQPGLLARNVKDTP